MKETRIIMGMPISIEIVDSHATQMDLDIVYDYFTYIDNIFSTYKSTSEISQINNKRKKEADYSNDVRTVLQLCEETKQATEGYFNIVYNNSIDPSGLVKGWAIHKASELLKKRNMYNFSIDAGGDIQTQGLNMQKKNWTIGIRNPFNRKEIIKVVSGENIAVATSGTAIRGQHIYNPHKKNADITDIVSLSIIGNNIYEADRFATPAFAMGKSGIYFIEKIKGLEGYMIDKDGIATYTSKFNTYTI